MEQSDLLERLIEVLEQLKVPYGIAGSHASMAFGEPRLTTDIDVVVQLSETTLAAVIAAFPFPEYYVSEDGARHAIRAGGMFNIVHPTSGQKIDFIVPTFTHDKVQLTRLKRAQTFTGQTANFISPEDVIIKKMEYYREGGSEKHLRDITGVLKVTNVDTSYIEKWVQELKLQDIWTAILDRLR